MESETESFNWDLKWFLKNLVMFRNNVNAPNETTMNLLDEALDEIDNFVGDWRNLEVCGNGENSGWSAINEDMFELRRFLFCRVCKMSFAASHQDYIAHLSSREHNSVLSKYFDEYLGGVAPLPRNRPFVEQDTMTNYNNQHANHSVLPGGFDNFTVAVNLADSNRAVVNQTMPYDMRMEFSPAFLHQNAFCNEVYGYNSTPYNTPMMTPEQNTFNGTNFDQLWARKRPHPFQSDELSNGAPKRVDQRPFMQRNVVDVMAVPSPINFPESNGITENRSFFESNVVALLSAVISKNERSTLSQTITADIKAFSKDRLRSVEPQPIGSRVNDTTVDENASLDISLELSDYNLKFEVKALMTSSELWTNVKLSENSRRGAVTAVHRATNTKCRLLFGILGKVFAKNNELVRCFFNVQTVCRHLVLCIRMSMESLKKPCWTEKFSGYIISLLVIFYFQATERLPSVKSLQESAPRDQCGEDNVAFNQPTKISSCHSGLSVLLTGFFYFYSKFDFADDIISVFEGCPINRSVWNDPDHSLSNSVQRFKRVNIESKAWGSSVMCMQDIFMHKNNVTQSISLSEADQFKEYCFKSYRTLRKAEGLNY